MNTIVQAFTWLSDPENWEGIGGIGYRIAQHLLVCMVVMLIAACIAVPIGVLVGHTGKGRGIVVALSGTARALPTLGVLTLLALWLGIGVSAPLATLAVLAIPPLLAATYSGIEAVDRQTIDAVRAVGMTEMQIVRQVELPLAGPTLIGGIRSATLQVVATATVAAYVSDTGLGRYLFAGLKTRDYAQMLGGALLIVGIALLLDCLFALAQRSINRTAFKDHTARVRMHHRFFVMKGL